jgi:hypothetical protein
MATLDQLIQASEQGTYGVDAWQELKQHVGEDHELHVDFFTDDGDLTEDPDEATHAALLCVGHDEGEYVALFGGPD